MTSTVSTVSTPTPVRATELVPGADVLMYVSPCCEASATGTDSGIACRNCYGPWDDYCINPDDERVVRYLGGREYIDLETVRRPTPDESRTLFHMQ